MGAPNPQALRPVRRKLENIGSRAWEHPADRAALTALRSLPGFDELVRKIFGAWGERSVRLAFQADAVRVGPRQFPRMHALWLGVLDTLDAPDYFDLYLTQSPLVNAGAVGLDKPWVVLLSGTLNLMNDDQITAIMGHELGHILSGHTLYRTVLIILLNIVRAGLPLIGLATTPILLALLEWYRKSEISCDRAGLLACQLPDAALTAQMKLAGGGRDEEMSLYEFLAQADEYRHSESLLDQVLKTMNGLGMTHPFAVMRAALLRDWIEDGSYDRVLRGEYPRRGDAADWREDVAAGVRHYTDSLHDATEKAGEAMRRFRDAWERGFKGEGR